MSSYNHPSLGKRDQFRLDLNRLNQALEVNKTTGPVFATGMAKVLDLAAQVTKIPLEFFETVLELECSYPRRGSYSSDMPRDGDSHKRLPDPRYPHPSAWSARKGGKYHGLANVNSNTQIYIGVTQMSFDFWQEVSQELRKAGVDRRYLPAAWWQAPLLIQVIAPLVYFSLYGRTYSAETDVTPATVYMLHQQGPGWVRAGMRQLAGRQSKLTQTVWRDARIAAGHSGWL